LRGETSREIYFLRRHTIFSFSCPPETIPCFKLFSFKRRKSRISQIKNHTLLNSLRIKGFNRVFIEGEA
jgi:hypothetical protein